MTIDELKKIEKPNTFDERIRWLNIRAFAAVRMAEQKVLIGELKDSEELTIASQSVYFESVAQDIIKEITGENIDGNFVPGHTLRIAASESGEQNVVGMFQFAFTNSQRIDISLPRDLVVASNMPNLNDDDSEHDGLKGGRGRAADTEEDTESDNEDDGNTDASMA